MANTPTNGDDDPLFGDFGADDTIHGLDGNDRIYAFGGHDQLFGDAGNDYLDARTNVNDGAFMDGGDGNDTLSGGASADTMQGGAGSDFFADMGGNDSIDGGAGTDDVTYVEATRGVIVDLGQQLVANDGFGGLDFIANVENVTGSTYADAIAGDAGNNVLQGLDGDDTLSGGGGDDAVYGWEGADSLSGGSGNDTVSGFGYGGNKTMDGGDGNDSLSGGSGNSSLSGGAGQDTLIGGTGSETLDGGDGNDSIYSGDGSDSLQGGAGDDYLQGFGYAGNKTFDGGGGNDTIFAGGGNDSIAGGAGNDSLVSGDGNDTLSGGDGDDALNAQTLAGTKLLDGGAGNDSLFAGTGASTLLGGDGNDLLNGASNAVPDFFDGGAGDDTVFAGPGNDTLVVGPGVDQLFGGLGNDTYQIDSRTFYISDVGGNDTANVSADWVKLPGSIENVKYVNGARPLPYWIDALLPSDGNGLSYASLLGANKNFFYGFSGSLPAYDTQPSDGTQFVPFNDTQKAFAKAALDYVAGVTGLTFTLTTNLDQPNTIVFASNNASAANAGYAYNPTSSSIGSDIFINWTTIGSTIPADSTYSALVFIHEIGHAIGLKHPFEQDGLAGTLMPAAEDNTTWTVMSYTGIENPAKWHLAYSDLDIAALQYLYGPSPTARAGNDTYVLDATKSNFIWDGNGTDNIDGSALTQNLVLSLDPGDWSYIGTKADLISAAGQVTVNFGTVIENATGGSGADAITGNAVANSLVGGTGNDTLVGGAGDDTLSGGAGNDSLTGGAGNDSLIGGAGTDIAVYSGSSDSYTITGTRDAATIVGADGTDVLAGVEQVRFSDGLFALPAPAAGTTIGGMAYAWKGHQLLSGVAVTATAASNGGQSTAASDSSGMYQVASATAGSYSLAATRGTTDSGSAINSSDALAALRIAVGVNPNTGTTPLKLLSPYQVIAADVNEDGVVNSADALAILRMAVKAPTAPAQKWVFVDETLDLWDEAHNTPSLNRTGFTYNQGAVASQGGTANLVGILKGDVNGSWALDGSAKVEDNDPAHFTTLGSTLGVPTDIWGV